MARWHPLDVAKSRRALGATLIISAFIVFAMTSDRIGVTRAQLIALIPVVAGLCLVMNASLRSRSLVIGVSIALLSSALFVISPNQSSESVAIASLAEDPAGAHTRSLRVGIVQASSGKIGARALPQRFGKFEKREALFARESNISLLVFGTTKWLEVSTRGELKELKSSKFPSFWISRQLPEFGINPAPTPQTASFLSELASALNLPVSDPTRQANLRALGELAAPWRSQSHRAVPWILLAGDQIERLVTSWQGDSVLFEESSKNIRFSLDRAAHFAPPKFSPRLALTARHIKTCLLTIEALRSASSKNKKAAILANKRVIGVLKGKPRSLWRYGIAKASKRNIQILEH